MFQKELVLIALYEFVHTVCVPDDSHYSQFYHQFDNINSKILVCPG